MKYLILLMFSFVVGVLSTAPSLSLAHGDDHKEDEHEHAEEGKHAENKKDDHGHDHGDEHAHSDDHAGETEESSAVGLDKGITERSAKGFKLSQEAQKSFGLEAQDLTSATVEIEKRALLTIKDQKLVYLSTDGWISKIPVQVLSQANGRVKINLSTFSPGQKILVKGIGFVRTSELLLEQGASHGHSH